MKQDLDPKLQADDTESPAELEGEIAAEKATFEDVEPEETK